MIEDFQTPIGRKDIVTVGRDWLHAGILGISGIAGPGMLLALGCGQEAG